MFQEKQLLNQVPEAQLAWPAAKGLILQSGMTNSEGLILEPRWPTAKGLILDSGMTNSEGLTLEPGWPTAKG